MTEFPTIPTPLPNLPFEFPIKLDPGDTLMLLERMFGHGAVQNFEQMPAEGELEDNGIELALTSALFQGDLRLNLLPDGTWFATQLLTVGS